MLLSRPSILMFCTLTGWTHPVRDLQRAAQLPEEEEEEEESPGVVGVVPPLPTGRANGTVSSP